MFFWIMPTGGIQSLATDGGKDVSILVLLDNAYRPVRVADTGMERIEFQSLFFWIMPTGSKAGKRLQKINEFQSLFFWIMPTGLSP